MPQTGNREAALSLAGIILAAGASTRFGSPKQAARIGGETMLALAVRRALVQCAGGVIVVTGANHEEVAPLLDELPVQIIRNRRWREGMGSSIRAGMEGVARHSAGVLLMLGDQPAVTVADLGRLIKSWQARPAAIAASRYAGSLGVPAIFPRQYWRQLHDLQGEGGAKQVIRAAQAVSAVNMQSAALDIDTKEQLKLLN